MSASISFGSDYFTSEAYKTVPRTVAYKFSASGKNHQKMINEMDKFIKQYEKDFEPEEQNRTILFWIQSLR